MVRWLVKALGRYSNLPERAGTRPRFSDHPHPTPSPCFPYKPTQKLQTSIEHAHEPTNVMPKLAALVAQAMTPKTLRHKIPTCATMRQNYRINPLRRGLSRHSLSCSREGYMDRFPYSQ